MAGYRSRRSPAWTTAELLDLLSRWGEEAVQSQLCLSRRNCDTYGQISQGLCERGYDQDTLQCKAKIKELRQAYHKAMESNCRSDASSKMCWFYKELDAILSGDLTTTTSPLDTSAGLEVVERGPNPEDKVTDDEVELDDDVELEQGDPVGRQTGTVLHSRGV
ncbi:hypothetical protein UY3_07564 [Chelonia mydas]|uniref:Myb/SANT-like DNA-binding domain-containing protein n=1 Tax=Chelonia mydas TaxID=8469 RepID=M7BBE9_CHEMY|nr:hypothetical protein UY3_07564 [Chelonia mydas]